MFVVSVHVFNEGALAQTTRKATFVKKPQSRLTGREIAQRVLPSVVIVVAQDTDGKPVAFGSGFFVQPTVIATNYHVIKDATSAYVRCGDPKFTVVGVVGVDRNNDLALLKLAIPYAPPLTLGSEARTSIGDEVFVAGNPHGLEGTFSQGNISGFRGDAYIQITAPISPGSSGGPVMDGFGRVIGVATARIKEGQNLNFAVSVDYLKLLLANVTTRPTPLPLTSQTQGQQPTQRSLAPVPPVQKAPIIPFKTGIRRELPRVDMDRPPPPPPGIVAPPASTSTPSTPSLEETASWLKARLEGLSVATDKFLYSVEHISVSSSCYMDLRINYNFDFSKRVAGKYSPTLHLVERVEAGQNQSNYWAIWLKFRSNIYEYNEFYNSLGQLIGKKEDKTNSIVIFTGTEDLAVRGANAFNNLIKICGGGVRKEPF